MGNGTKFSDAHFSVKIRGKFRTVLTIRPKIRKFRLKIKWFGSFPEFLEFSGYLHVEGIVENTLTIIPSPVYSLPSQSKCKRRTGKLNLEKLILHHIFGVNF